MTLFFTILIFLSAPAQQKTPLSYICSLHSKKPIPWAHIVYLKSDSIINGTYSSEFGDFLINDELNFDSIIITHVGYETVKLRREVINDTIFLEERNEILSEVVISEMPQPIVFLGEKKRIRSQSHSGLNGTQLVTLINNPYTSSKRITNFVFHLNKIKSNSSSRLRIVFFENANGVPGKQLPFNPVLEVSQLKAKKVNIPIDSVILSLPTEGIFAGIEWIGCDNELNYEGVSSEICYLAVSTNHYNNKKHPNKTYTRQVFKSNKWYDVNRSIQTELSIIPAFGITVYE